MMFLRLIAVSVLLAFGGAEGLATTAGVAPHGREARVSLTQVDEAGRPIGASGVVDCVGRVCRGEMPLVIEGVSIVTPLSGIVVPFPRGESVVIWVGPLPGCETVPPGVPWRDSVSISRGWGDSGGEVRVVKVVRLIEEATMTPSKRCKTAFVRIRGLDGPP